MTKVTGLTLACLAGFVLLVGCEGAPSMEMQQVERPTALDQLDAFVGTWKGEANMTNPETGEPMMLGGTETVSWAADGWALTSDFDYEMLEGRMKGVSIMLWDPAKKHFTSFMAANDGGQGHGSAEYDEATKTWTMKGYSMNPYTGMKTYGEGTVKFVGADTQVWEWAEYTSPMKTKQLMSFKGSSKRQ